MTLRLVVKHFSAVSGANLANGLLGMAFVPFAVSRLGQAGYGVFAIYLIVQSWVVLAELGFGKDLVRRLAGAPPHSSARAAIMQSGRDAYIAIVLLLGALAPILILVIPKWILPVPPDKVGAVQVIVLLTVCEYAMGMPIYLRQNACMADHRFSDYARFVFGSGVLRYSLLFGALALTTRPELVVLAAVARRPAEIWLSGRMLGPIRLRGPWVKPAFGTAIKLLRRSAPLSGAQVLQTGVVSAGGVLVNAFYGLVALGSFRAAFDLSSKVWLVSNTAGLIAFPGFARAVAEPRGQPLAPLLARGLLVSRVVYGLVAVGGTVVGPVLLPAVGLTQSLTLGLFGLLLGGTVWNAHATVSYELVQAVGAYRRAAALSGVALALLVASFFLLQGRLGPLTIGWAWLASQLVYSVLCDGVALNLVTAKAALRTRLTAASFWLAVPVVVANAVAPRSDHRLLGAAVALGLSAVLAVGALSFVRREAMATGSVE